MARLPLSLTDELFDPGWPVWQRKTEYLMGIESLISGCDDEDGFSLESAFAAFCQGISPRDFADGMRAVKISMPLSR